MLPAKRHLIGTALLTFGFATACFSGGSGDDSPDGFRDAAPSSDSGAESDAEPFSCADDSAIEPNETLKTATITGIPAVQTEVQFVALAMCSTTDRDVFRMEVDESGANISAAVVYDPNRAQLRLELLNSNGVLIAEGLADPKRSDRNTLAIFAVPAGAYFVRVSALTGATNYDISMVAQPLTTP